MKQLTVEFEFEIGDLVFYRSANHFSGSRPRRFVIIERQAHQCSGGTQCFYVLDNVDTRVAEIALTKCEPTYRPTSNEELIDMERIKKAFTHTWASFAKTVEEKGIDTEK